MLEKFACPVCKQDRWNPIERYLYAQQEAASGSTTRWSSLWRRISLAGRVLIFARPRAGTLRCRNLTAYHRLRRAVLFDVWFPRTKEVRLASIYCGSCGFACYTPRPEEGDISAKYNYLKQHEPEEGDLLDAKRSANRHDRQRAERIYRLCMNYFENKQLDVLDYGGADGKLMVPFLEHDHRCHLIDYYEKPIEGVLKLGDDIHSSRIDKTFDLIICSHVLEHVSDLSHLVSCLKALLNPGGILYAEVPQELWCGVRIEADPVTHINFFTLNSFSNLFLAQGYRVLERKQEMSDYSGQSMAVIWSIVQADKDAPVRCESAPNLLACDTETMLYPSRIYSAKRLFGLFVHPMLLRFRAVRRVDCAGRIPKTTA